MKLRVIDEYAEGKVDVVSLDQLVISKVDGNDYEVGQLEALQYTVNNQSYLIAKLIEALNPTDAQLTDWLAQYGRKIERVIEAS